MLAGVQTNYYRGVSFKKLVKKLFREKKLWKDPKRETVRPCASTVSLGNLTRSGRFCGHKYETCACARAGALAPVCQEVLVSVLILGKCLRSSQCSSSLCEHSAFNTRQCEIHTDCIIQLVHDYTCFQCFTHSKCMKFIL